MENIYCLYKAASIQMTKMIWFLPQRYSLTVHTWRLRWCLRPRICCNRFIHPKSGRLLWTNWMLIIKQGNRQGSREYLVVYKSDFNGVWKPKISSQESRLRYPIQLDKNMWKIQGLIILSKAVRWIAFASPQEHTCSSHYYFIWW